jgi:hypothetical protein
MENLVPSEFYLSQNYPNPFSETTKIKYCLPVKAEVSLSVFNNNGKKVKELVDNIQEAGTYEVILDTRDFSSGNYYYKFGAVDLGSGLKRVFNETKKMIYLK